MRKVLVFDPGDHTGWVARLSDGSLKGGTIFSNKSFEEDIDKIKQTIVEVNPDVIVFETFHLYPGAAPHLAHNEFYPCQIIGLIKTLRHLLKIPTLVAQSPSTKRYSGGLDDRWKFLRSNYSDEASEHMKDSYLHLRYYELNGESKQKDK